MTNDTQQASTPENPSIHFGARLKSAREALGWEQKDAASQLRLNERIIVMLEKERYPSDLPATFIRGYIRSYAKLLQIPECEVTEAIEPIKPEPIQQEMVPGVKPILPLTSGNYFMQIFTYLIIFTMLGLVATWWYSHSSQPTNQSEVSVPPNNLIPITPSPQQAPPIETKLVEPIAIKPLPPENNTANTAANTKALAATTTPSAPDVNAAPKPDAPKLGAPKTTKHAAINTNDNDINDYDEEDIDNNNTDTETIGNHAE